MRREGRVNIRLNENLREEKYVLVGFRQFLDFFSLIIEGLNLKYEVWKKNVLGIRLETK